MYIELIMSKKKQKTETYLRVTQKIIAGIFVLVQGDCILAVRIRCTDRAEQSSNSLRTSLIGYAKSIRFMIDG